MAGFHYLLIFVCSLNTHAGQPVEAFHQTGQGARDESTLIIDDFLPGADGIVCQQNGLELPEKSQLGLRGSERLETSSDSTHCSQRRRSAHLAGQKDDSYRKSQVREPHYE